MLSIGLNIFVWDLYSGWNYRGWARQTDWVIYYETFKYSLSCLSNVLLFMSIGPVGWLAENRSDENDFDWVVRGTHEGSQETPPVRAYQDSQGDTQHEICASQYTCEWEVLGQPDWADQSQHHSPFAYCIHPAMHTDMFKDTLNTVAEHKWQVTVTGNTSE